MLNRPEHEKHKASHRLADFIQRNRIIFVVLALAVIISPIVFYVIDSINRKTLADATLQSFTVDTKLEQYTKETDKDKKAALEKELFVLFEETINRYRNYDAGIRALRHRAAVNTLKMKEEGVTNKKELLLSVLTDYLSIPEANSVSVMAPTALMDAAAMIGNLPEMIEADTTGNFKIEPAEIESIVRQKLKPAADVSLETFPAIAFFLYQHVVGVFPKSVHVPEALINLGALYEAKQSYKEAGEIYDRLESDFSLNDWTKVAINRKIRLQAEGLIFE